MNEPNEAQNLGSFYTDKRLAPFIMSICAWMTAKPILKALERGAGAKFGAGDRIQ